MIACKMRSALVALDSIVLYLHSGIVCGDFKLTVASFGVEDVKARYVFREVFGMME